MTSNLGCIGLGVGDVEALGDLLSDLIPASTASRLEDGTVLYVWSDPSGARLTVSTDRAGAVADVTPSYDAEPGARLGGLVALHDAIVAADVLVEDEVVTRMAVEVLGPPPVPGSGPASVTAFGVDVSCHATAAEFSESPASLLVPEAAHEEEPVRLGAESFISFGMFADPGAAEPVARLSGVVVEARSATVAATGQAFHAVRLRTVGMEVELCLAADDHPTLPEAGSVVAGTVYLVADLERAPARRRWFGR